MKKFMDYSIRFKIVVTVSIFVIVGLSVSVIYLSKKIYSIEHPEKKKEMEIVKLVSEVGKYILLPEDEKPTVATVLDPELLSEQSFFEGTQIGDRVIVYSQANTAILWRPSIKRIIKVSSVHVGDDVVTQNIE